MAEDRMVIDSELVFSASMPQFVCCGCHRSGRHRAQHHSHHHHHGGHGGRERKLPKLFKRKHHGRHGHKGFKHGRVMRALISSSECSDRAPPSAPADGHCRHNSWAFLDDSEIALAAAVGEAGGASSSAARAPFHTRPIHGRRFHRHHRHFRRRQGCCSLIAIPAAVLVNEGGVPASHFGDGSQAQGTATPEESRPDQTRPDPALQSERTLIA